jgi:hypothetical protein
MGAPVSSAKSADQPAAETLLTAFKTINAAERRKHASVLNYWLSIRGDKEFPPLDDLDPLELSDAGPNSILLELISGGHDAEVRHLGEGLVGEERVERIIDAPSPSILACIAKKLPIVAISRDFLAFEDEYEGDDGQTRCWVTLLPLSAGGAWVDYVYALVSADSPAAKAASKKSSKKPEPEPEEIKEATAEEIEQPVAEEAEAPVDEAVEEPEAVPEPEAEEPAKPVASAVAKAAPGFSKLFDSLAGLTGFYGSQPVKVEPVAEPDDAAEPLDEEPVEQPLVAEEPEDEPVADDPPAEEEVAEEQIDEEVVAEVPVAEEVVAEEPVIEKAARTQPQPASASEGTLQKKLTEVRTKTDEARLAKIRANAALYEGLSAAYDFALDAEDAPEEYLRLVEAQGLKIQLRSPMKPVVKLAFEGMCDEATIKQLEAVLAWAFEQELPRGTLAERIEQAGGVGYILIGEKKAA